jgi:branched-chain amino acid transport system permease protein
VLKRSNPFLRKRVILGLVIALIVLVPVLIRIVGWRTGYLIQVYAILPIWIIGGLSLTVITGYVGEISVAQAALMGMGAYVSALLSTNGVSLPISIGAALIAAVLGALILGVPTLRLRGPYFVVASMAFNGIFHQIVVNWIDVTRGPNGISGVPSYGRLPIIGTYLPWLIAIACLIAVWYLGQTRLGKSMMAVRDDELAASAIGLRVAFIKSIAFVFSGFIAGLAGVLLGHLIGYISPEFYTIDQSVFLLTMVLLGGVRKIEGAALGAVVMVVVQEVLRNFVFVQILFYGVIMLAVILFVPQGLWLAFEGKRRN